MADTAPPPDPILQLVLMVPCHPTRHTDLRDGALSILDPVQVGAVAGIMASAWSTAASLLTDLCGAGWDASGDALSSGNYVQIHAIAPVAVSYAEALRFAQTICDHAARQGIETTLWMTDDPRKLGDVVRARGGAAT